MRIGLLKEEKIPVDKRVPLTPLHCKKIKLSYPNVDVLVQSSDNRCFSDNDYSAEGIQVVNDISICDILLGIKEVPIKIVTSQVPKDLMAATEDYIPTEAEGLPSRRKAYEASQK